MKKEKIFGTFVGAPSEEQLQLYFQLTDFDKEIINEMRLPSTKLGFAVQLGTVRFLGTFFTDFSKIPLEVIIYLANQLSIDPREFDSYSRKMTISQSAIRIEIFKTLIARNFYMIGFYLVLHIRLKQLKCSQICY